MSATAYAGLLKGIRNHGLARGTRQLKLLLGAADAADELSLDAELGTAFRLSPEKVLC